MGVMRLKDLSDAPPVLRIFIDPQLGRSHAPEVHWAWRWLLTTCGWAWQEAPPGAPCDVAWVCRAEDAPSARLVILANPSAWLKPEALHLGGVSQENGMAFPRYAGERAQGPLEEAADGRLICRRDVAFDVFWLATGQEERFYPRDRHGFHRLEDAAIFREGVLLMALASQIAAWLEKTLIHLGFRPPVPRWPAGRKAAVAAGHDVDYPEVNRLLEPARKLARWGVEGLKPAFEVFSGQHHHWHFDDWVAMEQNLGLRSAFYFVPHRGSLLQYAAGTPDPFYDISGEKFRQLFRFLRQAGVEIGLHASYRAYQNLEHFRQEKQYLEEASGGPVSGNRHHYWHLDPELPEETLWMHEQIGLEYDSSLVFDHFLGWRRGLLHPFFPFHPRLRRELATLQLPPAWMDDQLFQFRAYNQVRPTRLETLKLLAERVACQGGCLTVDIHDYVYDDHLFPGWRQTYQDLLHYLQERGDYWFATPLEIARHWAGRYRQILDLSQGLKEGLAG